MTDVAATQSSRPISRTGPLRSQRRFLAASGVTLLAIMIASAFLMPLRVHGRDGAQGPVAADRGRRAALSGGAGDVRVRGRGSSTSTTSRCRTASIRALALARAAPRGRDLRRPGQPGRRRDPMGRPLADAPAALGVLAEARQLHERLELDQLPAAVLQHARDRDAVDDRRGGLVRIFVAYGFSRFRFPGRNGLFILMLATIILPFQVTLIPTYAFYLALGWIGTWLPLIVPHFFANAYNVFLLRQYFLTIPRDLDEAAMIDGAGPFRILRSVIIPQADPGDRRGHPVPLLLRLERVLPAADLPAGPARPPAARRSASPGSTRCTRRSRR